MIQNAIRTFVPALVVAAWLLGLGCENTTPESEIAASDALEVASYESLVGVWRFEYTPERRTAYEAELAREFADPAKLEQAKREAVEEADASEIEFTADGWYLSRIAGQEIARHKADAYEVTSPTSLVARGTIEGKSIEVPIKFVDADTIVMTDPRKGGLVFHRK